MPKTLLVGLDGSKAGAGAVELGIQWAQQFKCLLVGIAIIDEPRIRGDHRKGQIPPSYQMAYDMQMHDARGRAEQILEQFAIRCSEAEVSSKLLEAEGSPSEKLLQEAERYDLLILGRETFFDAGKSNRHCETLHQVLHCTPRPVVVAAHEPPTGKRVLIAYDGSQQAARVLQLFAASGLDEIGQIHVLTIHPNSSVDAMKIADRAIEFLSFQGIVAKPHPLVVDEDAGHSILREAEELDAGMLVMGVYGQPRLREFLLGSVTRTVLADSRLPLFLYH